MKMNKDRVIAIDYFRGVFIIAVLLNHALLFSRPFNFLAGNGVLWTTAAELFLLISGLTLWIVRGKEFNDYPASTTRKILKRAGKTYLIYIATAFLSYAMALFFSSHQIINDVLGQPQRFDLSFVFRMLALQYSFGWASFLLYFAVFLAVSPPALLLLRSKAWPILPLLSALVFLLNASPAQPPNIYGSLAIWQVYYFIGLTIGRFRLEIISAYYRIPGHIARRLVNLIILTAAVALSLSILYEYGLFPYAYKLAIGGWLPMKAISAYSHLLAHKPTVDFWLLNDRFGALRPVFALIFMTATYALFQRYRTSLLRTTGGFMTALGRNTLWIFVAQAIAIPILAIVPLPRNIVMNFLLTSFLILSMWALTKRRAVVVYTFSYLSDYWVNLKISYYESKSGYLQRYEEENI